jgi:hypothetical protein
MSDNADLITQLRTHATLGEIERDAAHLLLIECQNPGIDMGEVARYRRELLGRAADVLAARDAEVGRLHREARRR